MNNKLESINYIDATLIKNSELNYQLELHGEPGYQYVIGCDFGLITTNITISKIESKGVKVVRNITPQGLTISEQSLLIKQLWKDYNRSKYASIVMDSDKLGLAIYDCLSESTIDPRDGELLPPFINVDDDEDMTTGAISIIKFVKFIDRSNTYFMTIKVKRALEDNVLHFPISNSCDEEITQLKQEICDIKVKAENNGASLVLTRDNKDYINKVNRFTSFLLSVNWALFLFKNVKCVQL